MAITTTHVTDSAAALAGYEGAQEVPPTGHPVLDASMPFIVAVVVPMLKSLLFGWIRKRAERKKAQTAYKPQG